MTMDSESRLRWKKHRNNARFPDDLNNLGLDAIRLTSNKTNPP